MAIVHCPPLVILEPIPGSKMVHIDDTFADASTLKISSPNENIKIGSAVVGLGRLGLIDLLSHYLSLKFWG
jgi:hypothetical protein